MPFAALMKDTVDLIKPDGTTTEGLKASVQDNRIFMGAGGLLIEQGDTLRRRMSNGGIETFLVDDPGFHEGLGGIPAGYQMYVSKVGAPRLGTQVHQSVTYNMHGDNARVNNNSVDNSTNILQAASALDREIQALRAALGRAALTPKQKSEALEVVEEVESSLKAPAPKKTIVKALLASLPHVAEVATIVSTISQLLS